MGPPSQLPITIDAEIQAPVATAQLVHFRPTGPAQNVMHERETYWLDLCLTPRPRNTRACYHNHWNPHRFERLGTVFAVPPGETLITVGEGGPSQASVLCHLVPDSISAWFDGALRWTNQHREAGLDIRHDAIQGLMRRLAQELRSPGLASEILVELVTAQLAIELRRFCTTIEESRSCGGLAPWRLRLIDERLQEVRAAPTLTELAQLCQLSVRQLTRCFRTSRGCSIGDYVANSRLEHAKRLLATDQSIKAIAHSLGFSPSSFCCIFQRATGESPGQFRLRLLREE